MLLLNPSSVGPGPGPSVIVDGCDDPILFVHEAAMHLLQLPEGDVVQAHACHHEQKAVPQDPLVVFMLLLP